MNVEDGDRTTPPNEENWISVTSRSQSFHDRERMSLAEELHVVNDDEQVESQQKARENASSIIFEKDEKEEEAPSILSSIFSIDTSTNTSSRVETHTVDQNDTFYSKVEEKPELAVEIFSKFRAKEWTPEDIRQHPEEAFELFDANGDGLISVAELCFVARRTNTKHRRRGSLYNEMKLFQALDLDGDAVINRQDWKSVITNSNAFSDAALDSISKLCEIRFQAVKEQAMAASPSLIAQDEAKTARQPDEEDTTGTVAIIPLEVDEKAQEVMLDAFSVTTGIFQGASVLKRNDSRFSHEKYRSSSDSYTKFNDFPPKSSGHSGSSGTDIPIIGSNEFCDKEENHDDNDDIPKRFDLVLDLVALSLLKSRKSSSWYTNFFAFVSSSASAYKMEAYLAVLIDGQVLARTETVFVDLAIKFNTIRIAANILDDYLNEDHTAAEFELGFALYTRPIGLMHYGEFSLSISTRKFKVPQPNTLSMEIETAIGPLSLSDNESKIIIAKLLGSSQWVLADEDEEIEEDEQIDFAELCIGSKNANCYNLCSG